MAYGKVFYGRWIDTAGVKKGIEIYEQGYSSSVTEVQMAVHPVSKKMRGSKEDFDRLVNGQELSFNIIAEPTNKSQFDRLLTATYKDHYLVFYRNYGEASESVIFKGWTKPENIKRRFLENEMQMSVTATDALADLKDIEFKKSDGTFYRGEQSMLWAIREALSNIDQEGVLQLPFRIVSNVYEKTQMNADDNALFHSDIDLRRFNKFEGGKTKAKSCREVIEEILFDFTAKLKQKDGQYWIVDHNESAYAAANSLSDYVYEIPWSWSDSFDDSANRVAIDNYIDITDFSIEWGGSESKYHPLKGYSLNFYNKHYGTFPDQTVNDWNNWTVNNAVSSDIDSEGNLTIEVGTSDYSTYIESPSFNVVDTVSREYLKLVFEYILNQFTTSGTKGNVTFYVAVTKCFTTNWFQGDTVYFGTQYQTFQSENTDPYLVDNAGNSSCSYQIRIYLAITDANAELTFTPPELRKIVPAGSGAAGEEIAFDKNMVLEQSGGHGIPEIETVFGDSEHLFDLGRIEIGGNLSSMWYRYNGETDSNRYEYSEGGASLLRLTLQSRLNNRQSYTEYVEFDTYDKNDAISVEKVLKINSKYYEILGIDKEYREGKTTIRAREIRTSDVSGSLYEVPLRSINNTSTSSPYTETSGSSSVDFSTHSVTELRDVSQAGGGKILPSTEYDNLTHADTQLSSLKTTGSPIFQGLTLGDGTGKDLSIIFNDGTNRIFKWDDSETRFDFSEDVNIQKSLYEQGNRVATRTWSTLQNVTDQGNSTSNNIEIGDYSQTGAKRVNIKTDDGAYEVGARGSGASYSGAFYIYDIVNSQFLLRGDQSQNLNIPNGNLQVDGTGASTFAGSIDIAGEMFFENDQRLIWKDVGGTNRQILELASDDNVYLYNPATGGDIIFDPNGVVNITSNLQVDGTGDSYFAGNLQGKGFSNTGVTDFSGDKWRSTVEGDFNIRNLIVREAARFRELIIDQLSVIGGDQILSSARGKIESFDSGTNVATLEDPNERGASQFAVDDIFWIRTVDIDGGEVKFITGRVSAVNNPGAGNGSPTITLAQDIADTSGSFSDISNGDVIAQRGSTSDTNRQNLIYWSANDTDSPISKYLSGVDSISAFNNEANIPTQIDGDEIVAQKFKTDFGNHRVDLTDNHFDLFDSDGYPLIRIFGPYAGTFYNSSMQLFERTGTDIHRAIEITTADDGSQISLNATDSSDNQYSGLLSVNSPDDSTAYSKFQIDNLWNLSQTGLSYNDDLNHLFYDPSGGKIFHSPYLTPVYKPSYADREDYVASDRENWVIVRASSLDRTVDLPGKPFDGQRIVITNSKESTYLVDINGNGNTIYWPVNNSGTSYTGLESCESLTLIYHVGNDNDLIGAGWYIIATNDF